MAKMHDTPMLDELEKGPWPSFVTDIKKAAEAGNEPCADLLGQLELSYKDKEGHWKHGGIVGVLGYGGGVIGRYSDVPDLFPGVEHFHTLRVNQPASKFYKTERLREVMDIWNRRGSGMLNMHGSTGDMVLLGAFTEELEPIFAELTQKGWDLGGSGSALCGPRPAAWARLAVSSPASTPRTSATTLTMEYPGRNAPSGLALQVQVQDRRLPQLLRGLPGPLRLRHHRHLAR